MTIDSEEEVNLRKTIDVLEDWCEGRDIGLISSGSLVTMKRLKLVQSLLALARLLGVCDESKMLIARANVHAAVAVAEKRG